MPEQAHPWGRVPTVFPPRGLCRSISDGAAAVVVMSAEVAERAGCVRSPRSARTATSPGRTTRCIPSRPKSSADQLAKLADLRDRGVITAEEFDREKAKVLA